jgi:voltage-gated potassium channel
VSPQAAPQHDRWRALRRRVYDLLDPDIQTFWDRVVHRGLIALILVNVVAVVLESVPSIDARFGGIFLVLEVASVVVFTVEYALRLWTAVEHMPVAGRSGAAARLAFARTPSAIIDLLAVLPFYLALFDLTDLRVFALFRLVRFFKLVRYSSGLASLFEAIYAERHALLATLLILAGVMLSMATLMHLVEGAAQPDRFGTIPDAMWWAIITLTTVGYGDVVPITPLGKVVAGVTAVMGIAMLALPVGIIATSFSEVIHRREFVVTWSMVARVPIFGSLGAGALAEIMQLLYSRTARKGEVIAGRGEKADAMYFIVSGKVDVELPDADDVALGPGEFFGEIALLTGEERTATVRACDDTQLLVLRAHDLDRLMSRVPEIGARIREVGHTRAPDRVDGDRPRTDGTRSHGGKR